MAPKKDAGKGAPGAPGAEDVIAAYKAQCDALNTELAARTTKLLAAEDSLQVLTQKLAALGKTAASGEDALAEVAAEATRQHRSMQVRYEAKIDGLEAEVARLTKELEAAKLGAANLAKDMAAALRAKDEIIARLHKRCDDMAGEFSDMLGETMRRLASKIDIAPEEGGSSSPSGAGGEGAGGGSATDVAASTLKKLQEMTV